MNFSLLSSLQRLMRKQAQVQWALVDQAVVSGVNFATAIIVARNLGMEEFGRFSLAWITLLFFSSLQVATVCVPMMSIGPKQTQQQRPQYYAALTVQQAMFCLATFVLILLIAPVAPVVFGDDKLAGLALPLAAATVAFQAQDFIRRYFFTRGDSELALVNDIISYGGQLAVLLWLFSTSSSDAVTVLWVIAATSSLAFVAGCLRMEKLNFSFTSFLDSGRRQWHSARWMAGTVIMNWLSGNAFLIGAGVMLGVASVGLLRAVQTIANLLNILFQGLNNIIPVEAARMTHDTSLQKLRSYLRQVTLAGGTITVAIALLLGLFPETWFNLAYGDQASGQASILSGFAVVYALMFFSIPPRSGLIAIENTHPIFISYAAQALFTLLAVYPLIAWLGIWGVPVGMLGLQIINIALLSRAFSRVGRLLPRAEPGTGDP